MNLRLPPRPSLSVKRHKRDRFSPCVGVLVCTYHQELFLFYCISVHQNSGPPQL